MEWIFRECDEEESDPKPTFHLKRERRTHRRSFSDTRDEAPIALIVEIEDHVHLQSRFLLPLFMFIKFFLENQSRMCLEER